jgi:hypothetical protein
MKLKTIIMQLLLKQLAYLKKEVPIGKQIFQILGLMQLINIYETTKKLIMTEQLLTDQMIQVNLLTLRLLVSEVKKLTTLRKNI